MYDSIEQINDSVTHFKLGDQLVAIRNASTADEYWYDGDHQLHRNDGLPAVIRQHAPYRLEKWYIHGVLHRDGDLPAIHCSSVRGTKYAFWFKGGVRHRDGDLPASIEEDCHVFIETWYKDGQIYREGGKPTIVHKLRGEIVAEFWHRGNQLHRDGDLPARVEHGKGVIKTVWCRDGRTHRDGDLPAFISYYGGMVIESAWYKDGHLHRDGDLPAIISREVWGDGVEKELWFKHGEQHRDSGPSSIVRDMSTKIVRSLKFMQNGALHNPLGPARCIFHKDGAPKIVGYFLNNVKLTKDEWRERTQPPAIVRQINLLPYPIATEILVHYCID
jgi:hypothetical protein